METMKFYIFHQNCQNLREGVLAHEFLSNCFICFAINLQVLVVVCTVLELECRHQDECKISMRFHRTSIFARASAPRSTGSLPH